jgi:hypothetical protein
MRIGCAVGFDASRRRLSSYLDRVQNENTPSKILVSLGTEEIESGNVCRLGRLFRLDGDVASTVRLFRSSVAILLPGSDGDVPALSPKVRAYADKLAVQYPHWAYFSSLRHTSLWQLNLARMQNFRVLQAGLHKVPRVAVKRREILSLVQRVVDEAQVAAEILGESASARSLVGGEIRGYFDRWIARCDLF